MLDANRVITVPNQSFTLVGEDSTQILKNKNIETLVLQDPIDVTKKITFSVANQNTGTNNVFQPPASGILNTSGNSTLVTTSAIQTLTDKTLQQPKLKENELASSFTVTFRTDNITEDRTIKFPDADATLLSTENVTLEDVTFGAGLAAANLTGRTRLQQYFYSGFN